MANNSHITAEFNLMALILNTNMALTHTNIFMPIIYYLFCKHGLLYAQ